MYFCMTAALDSKKLNVGKEIASVGGDGGAINIFYCAFFGFFIFKIFNLAQFEMN